MRKGQLAARPAQQLSIFAGGGYALVGMMYNLGACIRIMPSSPVCPFITGMYGYNVAIMIQGTDRYDEMYYGTTIGGSGTAWSAQARALLQHTSAPSTTAAGV